MEKQSSKPFPYRCVYDDVFDNYLEKINKVLPTNEKLKSKKVNTNEMKGVK